MSTRVNVGRAVIVAVGLAAVVVLASSGDAFAGPAPTTDTGGPVGVTLDGPGGCTGNVTAFAGNGFAIASAAAPGGGGASSSHALLVNRSGTVRWQGHTSTVLTNHHWYVDLDGIRVKSGASANDGHATTASGMEHLSSYLPSWLGATGTFYVNGQISGDGGACTGAVYIKLAGDPAAGLLFYMGLAFLVLSGLIMFFALPVAHGGAALATTAASPDAVGSPIDHGPDA